MDEFRHHQKESFASSHPEACDRLIRFFEDFEAEIASNKWNGTCLTAAYLGLQVAAWANDYLLPTKGYSSPLEFLKIVKTDGPKMASAIAAKKAVDQQMSDGQVTVEHVDAVCALE
jgi:hypothetical protein